MEPFSTTPCRLGEGALWHPIRQQLFWFDILGKRLLTRDFIAERHWTFEEHVSAAGWVDRDRLLIASESALLTFNLTTGRQHHICDLEADRPHTRSNDGRADPYGGFWVSTMGLNSEEGQGRIYRYYKGELRQLYDQITIPNAICFSPCHRTAYFTDSARSQVMQVALNDNGWPSGEPRLLADLQAIGLHPDGAVVDQQGNLWIAQWGYSRVSVFKPDGTLFFEESFPVSQITCPAFGGKDLRSLYVTSASVGLSDQALKQEPKAGKTFLRQTAFTGQAEHQVQL